MLKNHNWLLIADAPPVSEDKLRLFAANKKIMVLDGAYAFVKNSGLTIDILLGDFDTITPEQLEAARQAGIQVIHAPDQNKTDLRKGIILLDELGAKSIDICCATGGRLQHTLYNIRMLKKFYDPQRSMVLLTETEMIRYYEDREICIEGKMNDSVGLLGFPEAVVSSEGLAYEMKEYALIFEKAMSTCNALREEKATVQIKGGVLVIQENVRG